LVAENTNFLVFYPDQTEEALSNRTNGEKLRTLLIRA